MDFVAQTITTTSEVSSSGGGALMFYLFIWLVILVVAIIAYWKVFQKAGEAGWKSLIPIYNAYILLKIVGRPGWWLLLFLIPFVNIIISIIVAIDLAKAFGKSEVFGIVALWFFSLIGYLILGFGSATYQGVSGSSDSAGSVPPPPAPANPGPAAPAPPAAV